MNLIYLNLGVIVLTGLTGGITYFLVRSPWIRTGVLAVTILIVYSLWVGEFYLCSIQIRQ